MCFRVVSIAPPAGGTGHVFSDSADVSLRLTQVFLTVFSHYKIFSDYFMCQTRKLACEIELTA